MQAWRTTARDIDILPQWTVQMLKARLEKDSELLVLDVRQPAEWVASHIERAQFVTGGELPGQIDEVATDRPIATICGRSYRSSVSASLLQHHGHSNVVNVLSGRIAWNSAGFPITQD